MTVFRHDRAKAPVKAVEIDAGWLERSMTAVQRALHARAEAFRIANTHACDDYAVFKNDLDARPGFLLMHWDGTAETETKIKEETKATIRCIPLADTIQTSSGPVSVRTPGVDPVSGRPSAGRVLFARAY